MRISSSAAYALGVAAAVALLAGCSSGGSQSALAPTSLVPSSAQSVPVRDSAGHFRFFGKISAEQLQRVQQALHRGYDVSMLTRVQASRAKHDRGFIKHAVSSSASLAYVADPDEGVVYVYAWSVPGFTQGTLLGQLGGYFGAPVGVCVDKSANVYVADLLAQGVWIFPHNEIIPSGFLSDPGNLPWSCSVDPTTGNVAVSNLETTSGGSGSVYVYPGGSANWTPYYNIGTIPLLNMYYVGYGNKGNLFADGTYGGAAGDLEVVELAKGADYFTTLGLQGVPLTQLQYPGQIQWDGKRYLDIGDEETTAGNSPADCVEEPGFGCGAMYETTVSSGTVVQHGVTNFINTPYAYGTWTARAKYVIVPHPLGPGCVTPTAPSGNCTQVYYYGLGVSPVEEWDAPDYQLFPAFATISK